MDSKSPSTKWRQDRPPLTNWQFDDLGLLCVSHYVAEAPQDFEALPDGPQVGGVRMARESIASRQSGSRPKEVLRSLPYNSACLIHRARGRHPRRGHGVDMRAREPPVRRALPCKSISPTQWLFIQYILQNFSAVVGHAPLASGQAIEMPSLSLCLKMHRPKDAPPSPWYLFSQDDLQLTDEEALKFALEASLDDN